MNRQSRKHEIPLHLCQVLEEEFENLPHETKDDAAGHTKQEGADVTQPEGVEVSDPPKVSGTTNISSTIWAFRFKERSTFADVSDTPDVPDTPNVHDTPKVFDTPSTSSSGVTVRDDWMFHTGHVEASVLAAKLKQAYVEWRATHEDRDEPGETERDLYALLAFRYRRLWDGGQPSEVLAILNQILRDHTAAGTQNGASRTVFKVERFEKLALRDETRALLGLWQKEGGGPIFEGAEWENDAPGNKRFGKSDLARFRRLLLEDAFPLPAIKRVYDLRLDRAIRKAHQGRRSAICLSGGGIRSGTFALGVIQSLSRRGLLKEFDYLSTVSGGGYIGGWLSAWIHRHPRGLDGVVNDLNGGTRTSKLDPEPQPLKHLREYSSFITPKTGVLSADTWTFIAIYLRNLLLNWVVLIPLLASVLMIPRVANAVVLAPPSWRVLTGLLVLSGVGIFLLKPDRKTLLSLLVLGLISLPFILAGQRGWLASSNIPHEAVVEGVLLIGGAIIGGYAMAYMRLNRPSNTGAIRPGSFWDKHRDQSSFLWLCLLPLTISGTLLTTFWAWFRHSTGPSSAKTAQCIGLLGWGSAPNNANCFSIGGWELGEFTAFLVYGFMLGLTGWFLYGLLSGLSWVGGREEVRRRYRQAPRKLLAAVFWNGWREFVVTLLSSVIGSILLYVAAVKIPIFYDPVVPYLGPTNFSDKTLLQPLPYSAWYNTELYTWLAVPTYLFVFFLGITLFTGFTSRRSEKSPPERRHRSDAEGSLQRIRYWLSHPFDHAYVEDEDREWLARASAWVFIVAGGWTFLGGLVIFGPLLYMALGNWLAGIGGLSGLVSLLGGHSARTPGNKKEEAQAGTLQMLGINLLVVAAFIFFACIIIAVSLLSGTIVVWLASTFFTPSVNSLLGISPQDFAMFKDRYPFQSPENVFRVMHFPSWLYLLSLALGLQLFGRLFAAVINLNKFSLHAGYRDRIIRAFLGASRLKGERSANLFTGFDPRDNLNMEELRPGLLRESDFIEPDSLTRFVVELNRAGATLGEWHRDAETTRQALAAKYLRDEIIRTDGESRRYFKDPPESVNDSPSFRSALFADLGRILQDRDFGDAPGFRDFRERAEAKYAALKPPRGDARIMLNRIMLKEVFPYIGFPPGPYRLMHVVNMTLNLVGGDRLAWQQRRAESFTASPLHSGSLFVGYRRTRDYGGKNGITLGTAVATSGAAASSNMGYFSPSVFVTFVLTFFNARLGWWLGNPGVHGTETFYRSHPQSALSPILDEAFGLTNDENPYILLSDGGHFENLGLYEMIVRRCRNIIVVDGSADPEGSYDDLGGAVRKIRIDFGIPIEFPSPFPIIARPESEKKGGDYFVVGDIHYEFVDDPNLRHKRPAEARAGGNSTGQRHPLTGRLVYIKPAIYDTEPRDIFNYARGDPSFPHESTADQFFDEPQFESHRMLGYYILEKLIGDDATPGPPDPIGQFVELLGKRARTKKELDEKERDKSERDEKGRD